MKHRTRLWLPAVLVMVLCMGAGLACGTPSTPEVEVLLVTATFTPEAVGPGVVVEATVTLAPSSAVDVLPEATPEPPPAPQVGILSGGLCYPSEYIPPMTIYARNADTGETWSMHVPVGTMTYEIEVPAGNYWVFSWTDEGVGASYSEFVVCGLSVECPDHTVVTVPVAAGQRVTGVDICDYYMEEAVPRP
jgi:hypothetical protein